MDLIQPLTREDVFDNRVAVIRRKTAEAISIVRKLQHHPSSPAAAGQGLPDLDIDMQMFATSIWDQSLYKAWASIIHDLVPNLGVIETQLASLGVAIDADEILLFERTSFLVVSKWTSKEGDRNPYGDRFERMSNILKSWKHTCSKFTGTPRNAEQFSDFEYKMGANFSMFVTKFTTNTYILVCMPPGEARFNSAKLNVAAARPWFKFLDGPVIAPAAQVPNVPSQQMIYTAAAAAAAALEGTEA
jgi:Ras-related GTP-binding protein A/B